MKTLRTFLVAIAMVVPWSVSATPTQVDEAPISGGISSAVLPNIMFILDDSGSMCWQVMPDDAQFGGGVGGAYPSIGGNCADSGPANYSSGNAKYGPLSNHCNGVFYKPSQTYALPVKSDGTSFPSATVGTTRQDGFYSYTGITATTNVVSQVATGDGSSSSTLTVPESSGSSLELAVEVCPAGMTAPATGYYQTALMFYVASETPTFLGAHRVFGVYQSCAANKLTIAVTHVEGGGYSAPASTWRVARIPFTYEYSGSEDDRDFTYTAWGSLTTSTTFYTQCNAKTNSTPALFTFTPVTDLQNHANWYSYYRSRINTMKTAMSLAFGNMLNPDRYRIGFTTINYSGTSNTDRRYLDIGDYCDAATNCTQRQQFFNKVFSSRASGATGLRNALSKAGLIYAGKLLTGTRDPVQHSCQKNFSILSTDGYWNAGSGWPSSDVGGYRIPAGGCTGTACYALTGVGNQDGPGQSDYPNYDTGVATTVDRPQVDLSISGTSGTNDSLADVAMYYFKTKLRDGSLNNCVSGVTSENLCPSPGNVPVSARGEDRSRWDCNRYPHMNTFTVGLGVQGFLNPSVPGSYLSDLSDDYHGLKGDTPPKYSGPTINWSRPISGLATTVDDLWHAAVNGRGEYYSAKDSASIVSSLGQALATIGSSLGTGGAAGGSSQILQTGDSIGYLSRYATDSWSGDVLALEFDPLTGEVLGAPAGAASACSSATAAGGTPLWSAQTKLDSLLTTTPDSSSRKIYMVVGGTLADFKSSNLSSADFDPTTLSQYAGLSTTEKAQATKDNLVAYLRGVSSMSVGSGTTAGLCCEAQSGNDYRLFRDRDHALGDIVASSPVFVGKEPYNFTDTGYANYRDTVTATRARAVYVGSNDGMLHAFDAGTPSSKIGTGDELWAFVPTAVLPRLKYLADFNYVANHKYYVNGPITTGSISDGAGNWKTILVGGLGAGGRDYFALDVTNPAAPVLLWEFSTKNPSHADNMGYSFGSAVISKRQSDGKWVVLLPSGFNNEGPGDGKGHLFVLDAASGLVLNDIATTATASADKSGIGGLAAWVDAALTNNTTRYVYAGDLGGNLWRFDINTASVAKLAYFADSGGTAQPIMHRPEIGEVSLGSSSSRWVFVGTGKTLTEGDFDPTVSGSTATDMQSLYAVKDDLTTTYGSASFRSAPGVIALDLQAGGTAGRELHYLPIASSANGWYFDFDVTSGEKMTTELILQVGWLVFGTTAPNPAATACDTGFNGYLYFVDYNPQSSRTSTMEEIFSLGGMMTTGIMVYQDSSGVTHAGVTSAEGLTTRKLPEGTGSSTVQRVSWRELIN